MKHETVAAKIDIRDSPFHLHTLSDSSFAIGMYAVFLAVIIRLNFQLLLLHLPLVIERYL
jgi:hypothetical protein